VTHLGQRLSALIDGELEGSERERVLVHMTKCEACRDEAAALRTLKRRMSALGDAAAAGAGLTGLTGRLMRLSAPAGMTDRDVADGDRAGEPVPASPWPDRAGGELPERSQASPEPSPWPDRAAGELPGRSQASPEQRAGRYFLAGSLAVFLAGLGTAAFIAGGEPQPQAPTPPVTPSVDVMVFGHGPASDLGAVPPIARPPRPLPRPAFSSAHTSRTRT
jgi:anti-sigma factor RsiW